MSETVDQRALWDAAKPGDKAPLDYDGPDCVARGPRSMFCTRQGGHLGQHVATGIDDVFEVWDSEAVRDA